MSALGHEIEPRQDYQYNVSRSRKNNSPHPDICIDNQVIEPCSSSKLLGMTLDFSGLLRNIMEVGLLLFSSRLDF